MMTHAYDSFRAALDELDRAGGHQFDPRVVTALRRAALQATGESAPR